MIERLWALFQEFADYLSANVDPVRDALDIAIVTAAIYWMLVLVRGTRAIQIMVGLVFLIALWAFANWFEMVTVQLVLQYFVTSAPLILVVLFQHDLRRGLARVGRGFFRPIAGIQESETLEEVVRAAQTCSRRRVGALILVERETNLDDQIGAGTPVDGTVTKELLTSIFLPPSPLHDGAVVLRGGRIASAGCILPLTQRTDLPEGLGTRHRAAVGIAEETDALVVVVSEETGGISVVMGGEILRELEAPRLRVVLRDILSGEVGLLSSYGDAASIPLPAEDPEPDDAPPGEPDPVERAS